MREMAIKLGKWVKEENWTVWLEYHLEEGFDITDCAPFLFLVFRESFHVCLWWFNCFFFFFWIMAISDFKLKNHYLSIYHLFGLWLVFRWIRSLNDRFIQAFRHFTFIHFTHTDTHAHRHARTQTHTHTLSLLLINKQANKHTNTSIHSCSNSRWFTVITHTPRLTEQRESNIVSTYLHLRMCTNPTVWNPAFVSTNFQRTLVSQWHW